ncbi:pyridoxal phosphate-dependent aminotransferase [Rhodovulum sp. DZ06]|uniref:pyridoxal phosphate-dependent aminotransferase n=1 Tax=Rhodovulum sp. DZ06 TaxID=3425126 RepID=UPI003D32D547
MSDAPALSARGPRFTPLAQSLPASVPFVGPEAQERARSRPFRARIGANESVFGPSPRALAAMEAELRAGIWKYADPESYELREALAAHHGVTPQNVVIGEGIDGLLGLIVRLVTEAGTPIVTSDGAYPTFLYHVAGFGGQAVKVPYAGDHEDPDALLAAARQTGAPLVYFANPDNPMGSWHDAATVQRMIEGVPDGCLLILDEAYAECAPEGTMPPIDPNDPRVIRMRTFSKVHGMAGARIGYAIGEAGVIRAFEKVRNHFGINRVGQVGALAALADADYAAQTVARIAAARDRIGAIAAANGLSALPSAANFVAVDCGRGGDFARAVLGGLIARDVFVRMPFVAPQDRCIRVSAGTDADLDAFAEALPGALADAAAALPG